MSFFSASKVKVRKKRSLIPACGACGLHEVCRTDKMPVQGEGKRGILIVGPGPTDEDDKSGYLYSLHCEGGSYLREAFDQVGIDIDEDCWYTGWQICAGERPTDKLIEWCQPNVIKAIRDLNPRLIIPMGFEASKSVLTPYYRDSIGRLDTWVGWRIPVQKINTWICPTYSPHLIKESERDQKVYDLWLHRHLDAAINMCPGRPWDTVPDYRSEVQAIYDPEEAAQRIRRMIKRGKPAAFDYETNCLKPNHAEARIYTCAITQGKETIAFVVEGEARAALIEFLVSDVPKIGANNKFEDVWSRQILGVEVNNWAWDTMLSAHHLDNRPNITSVKFQAFTRLGFEPWDFAIKGFFQADHSMALNNIHQCGTADLLKYNGLDTIIEMEIAKHQKEEMKWTNCQ